MTVATDRSDDSTAASLHGGADDVAVAVVPVVSAAAHVTGELGAAAPATRPGRRGKSPAARSEAAGSEDIDTASALAPARPARKRKKPEGELPASTGETGTAPKRTRQSSSSARKRSSSIPGLAGRARALPEWQALLSLPDALFSALPALRQAILDHPLDEALHLVAQGLALALAPAAARVWIADATPWSGSASRVGGSGVSPGLRLRAHAHATQRGALDPTPTVRPAGESAMVDPLLEEVSSARRPAILADAVGHPLAHAWTDPATGALPALGTLAAFPLLARGQFLGVLAVGAAGKLSARVLAALEELADLAALAADRDRLLSYSRGQEALAQTVVQHAPVAMALITGPDYTLALANPAFALLLGLDGDAALVGKRLAEVAPDRARTIALSLRLDAAFAGDEPQAMIELPMHRESHVTYWNVTTSPVAAGTKGGALVAAVEVTRQVMARRRAQDSAEVAEERLRQMMSLHAASLAVASQLDADPRELLADLLSRSIGLLGALAGTIYVRDPRLDTLDVVVSQGLRRDYSGSRLEPGEGLAGQVALARRGLVVDDYHLYPFGAPLYVDEAVSAVIAAPLIHHNEVVGVLEVLDNASRRTFSDADLWLLDLFAAQAAQAIQNARMYVELERAFRKQRELDRLKDDFIATASHELRTPLTGVQGFLELLLDLPAAQENPLVHTFAQKAASAAEELADIAERLLQTSRLDTGRLELHTAPVRLATVVEEVLASARELRATREAGHELVSQVGAEVKVLADRARLKEILVNLVSNAAKYSPKGGRVTLDCEPFGALFELGMDGQEQAQEPIAERPTVVLPSLTREPSDDESPTQPRPQVLAAAQTQPYLMLTVGDEGMGISPGERSRLFGRFSRLDGARTSQIRGTGLGLYICRQLARAMDGDVWLLQSEPGAGSTFALALPAAPPATAPHSPASHDGASAIPLVPALTPPKSTTTM